MLMVGKISSETIKQYGESHCLVWEYEGIQH